jgi:Fic family protein
MNPDDFKQPSGELRRAGRGDAAYWAFVPAPLPPNIEWDTALVQALSRADRALGELAGLGSTIPNPHLLIEPFIRQEAVLSSRIEGTQADITDLYMYEAGQLPLPGLGSQRSQSDVREVSNYVSALEYGLDRVSHLPVSLRLIRETHGHLMQGVRGGYSTPGEFRKSQNWIGPGSCTLNEAPYVPPPVEEMQAALGHLEAYLHQEDANPALARLAFIHYQFESIHPFIDGNGRMGRLLLVLLLVHWGLLPSPLLYLSAYFERNRDQYYDLLMAVSQRSAWREWLLFFLRGIQEQSLDAAGRGRRLRDLHSAWHELLQHSDVPARMLGLADSLFTKPVISVSLAQKQLHVSNRTARQYIQKLVQLGILEQFGERDYARLYFPPGIFDILR